QHAPLVKRHAAVLGIKRYVQAHSIDPEMSRGLAASRGAPDPYDGVAEIWLDLDALKTRSDAAIHAGQQLLEDEQQFIDLTNSPIFLTEDHVIIP
ncbi:MAG TPA: EthD domain-containing protein, partial [Candidatus Acidoferrales bacterium]|nr:EthD domain-containing protein [Candidatus Acidoferrales bacterium]